MMMLASCEEEVAKYDELTEGQQEAIRQRGRALCIRDFTPIYERFKNESVKVFDSDSYERQDGFYHEFKGPSSTRKIDIRVWKQDRTANEIYFYITENLEGSSNYFLRITQAQNEAMIDSLLKDHCDKVYTSTSGSNGPVNVLYEYTVDNPPNDDFYDDKYVLNFGSLAYFGKFRKTRTVETKNEDNDRVGELQQYTSTLVAKGYDFEGRNVATNSTYYTQNFCEPALETATDYRFNKTSDTLKLTCAATPPVGWDLSI